MAVYSLGNRTTSGTIAAACLEIRTGATNRAILRELKIFMAAATASTFGLGRPAAIGVTPTSPVTLLSDDPNDAASGVQTALAWSGSAPTAPTNFFERFQLPATVGAGIIVTFPKGIIIPVSSSLVIWNISATGVADINVRVEEVR